MNVPRRADMLRWCEAEHAITEAVQEVEKMGADTRLTDAVLLLMAARDAVADFMDGRTGRHCIALWTESFDLTTPGRDYPQTMRVVD